MAEKEIIQFHLKRDGATAVRQTLLHLSQPMREAAIAILDDLIAETSKDNGPQSPTPTGSVTVKPTTGHGQSSGVYVQVPPRNPILLSPPTKKSVRRRPNLKPVKTTTVSAPVDHAGPVLGAAEFHPIPHRYTGLSNHSAVAQRREWARAEILQRLPRLRREMDSCLDKAEALAYSAP
ncbi:hypothetical protein BS47DRAFT_1381173 [Hydnum rufescens UP504]|uniref:Uncharacterized protein n=1 Tax=Hydnum rufescens UP504 TaxID=1448309 RepID=A0A9P6DZN0_9AGAM|nr:hypothetical protein BS47DRAFT_1381173 [Hydnum rufescens UP504]